MYRSDNEKFKRPAFVDVPLSGTFRGQRYVQDTSDRDFL